MQAKKARQSQIEGTHTERDGTVIRHHAMPAEDVLEAVEKLSDPYAAVYQSNRTKVETDSNGDKTRVPAPDNCVFFVHLDNGKECVVIVEFDSTIDPKYIRKDGNGDDYHTTVTVFEPDEYRNGEEFDYWEFLSNLDGNYALEIIKESPNAETTIGQTLAAVSAEGLSNNRVAENNAVVKQFSLSEADPYLEKSTKKYGNVENVAIEHFSTTDNFRTAGYICVTD